MTTIVSGSTTVVLNFDAPYFEEMKKTFLGAMREYAASSSVVAPKPTPTGSTPTGSVPKPPTGSVSPTGSVPVPPTGSTPPVVIVTGSLASLLDKNNIKSPSIIGTPHALVSQSVPPAGVWTNTTFGTRFKRLTQEQGVHVYSQLRALSDDSKFVLIRRSSDAAIVVIDTTSLATVFTPPGEWYAIRWLSGHKILALVGSPVRAVIYDMDTKLTTYINTPWDYAQTSQVWEEPSDDQSKIAIIARKASEPDWTIGVIDLVQGKVVWSKSIPSLYVEGGQTGTNLPDWAAVTPSGKYLAVQWVRDATSRCSGLELFDVQTGTFVRQIHTHHNHSDLYVVGGVDYVFTTVIYDPSFPTNNYPGIILENCETKVVTPLRIVPWNTQSHLSSLANGKNIAIVTAEGGAIGTDPFAGEIYAINLTNGDCIHLCHHRSKSSDYWTQPKGSVDKSGKYAVFSTDWDGQWNCFMVEIPQLF